MCAIKKISFSAEPFSKITGMGFSLNPVTPPSVKTFSSQQDNDYEESQNKLKMYSIASSAVAIASLGIAGIALHKNLKSTGNLKATISNLTKNIKNVSGNLGNITDDIKNLSGQINNVKSDVNSQITQVTDNIIRNTEDSIKTLNKRIDELPKMNFEVPGVFQTRRVTVMGLDMNLGTIISEITGKVEEEMRSILRTESVKRIFGLVERNNKPPKFAIVRMPTSELVPFSKAGGMAVIPKDLASNFAAVLNGHQKGAMILDTPLYTGQVAQNQFYEKIAKLSPDTGKFEGQYEYVRKIIGPKETKVETLATLNKVQELTVPLHTEKAVNNEKVNVYITDMMEAPVDYKTLKTRLTKEIRSQIAQALKKGETYETDFIRIAQNPDTKEIEAFGKYRTVLYDSKKFDLSARKLNEGEKFNLYRNDTLSSGETERMTYFSKFFTEQLYNSDESEFVLKALEKTDAAGNVIINKKTNKPEKELIKLSADAIIGNDWHTGPISAILRQLSTVKKYYGMDPQKADKLQNLPIMTILHNVEYKGSVDFSQERMFNIMFGEHAAKIVENAFMPDIAVVNGKPGLPQHLWNSMMTGRDINPQMMAASYSDILVPVSEQYGNEIATHSGYGSTLHDIFKMRARMFEFSDLNYVKSIVLKNNLDAKLANTQKTLIGINNGCDTSNNILSQKTAKAMERNLHLPENSIIPYSKNLNILDWHNHNKGVYLVDKVVKEVELAKQSAGKDNPLKLYLPELTDLTGVTVDTPVFALAGRIEDQKGVNIYARGILEFYKNYKGNNPPVFYIQGIGSDPKYMKFFLDAKTELAKTNPDAAKRMVAAGLFSEPGRYDGCKMMADFTPMPSWFEPFGLVHKENAKFNGSIPITNQVGGLTANLTDEINALFVKFQHRFDPNVDAVKINGENLGKVFEKAVNIYEDKTKFAQMLKASQEADHGWLVKDGPIDQYLNLLAELKVINPVFLKKSA